MTKYFVERNFRGTVLLSKFSRVHACLVKCWRVHIHL